MSSNFFNRPVSKKTRKKPVGSNRPLGRILGQFGGQILTVIVVIFLVALVISSYVERKEDTEIAPISQVARLISEGKVSGIMVQGEDLDVSLLDGGALKAKKEPETSLSESLINYGVTPAELQEVPIEVSSSYGLGFWLFSVLPILLPMIFVIVLFWLISRQMRGASMQAFTFGQSRARLIDPNDATQRVTFKDVAGVREAKEELLEIVDFLKSPKKFLDIGARIPKGVILIGAPGTGKTLLARAIAGEARVPFMYLSGSEFVEMFVGVGASRVRDLFQMAKKAAPSIIFIDEIDAIGRHRGSGMGGGNDEREQTLNQILVEMDGFEPTEKVIIVAATNRPDVLDPALLRPGRFDRRIILDQPDKKDREQILAIHAAKKPLGPDVNLAAVAGRTPGFSGADLANLMNEAAILAARESRKEITQYDLFRSVEKVMLGPERKSHILSAREKKITAYHEVGHALVSSLLEFADPVHKVSIIARGSAAGYTLKLPFEDRKLRSKKEFLDDIAVSLGGYVAEKMVFDDITTGASNDIMVSTAFARDMVTKYGMSDEIGPVAHDASSRMSVAGGFMTERQVSDKTAFEIDVAVTKIMKEAMNRAETTIASNRRALTNIADELIKNETLERDDFEKILVLNGIRPKKKPIDEEREGKIFV